MYRATIAAYVLLIVPAAYFSWTGFHEGDTVSFWLLACVVVAALLGWIAGRARIMQGDLRPEVLRAGSFGRTLAQLPVWLVIAFFWPLVERTGKAVAWWPLSTTFAGVDSFLPRWLAFVVMVPVGFVELLVIAGLGSLPVGLIRALFGAGHPLTHALEEAVPNFHRE